MSSISYVNTDVQIQKIWGHSKNRELLRQYLGNKSVLTSWYVLLEYKATVVLGFIRFYHHLKHQSFEDAFAAVRAEFVAGYKNYALRECNLLSDAVIAVDAPQEAEVCAFDNLFDLLCAVLGKKKHIFSDLTPRISRH